MNHRERLLAVLNHQMPDRIPWSPRLLLWHNARLRAGTVPEKWRGWSLREIERDLDLGTPARDGRVCRVRRDERLEVVTRKEQGKTITEYHTPVGMVRQVESTSEELERDELPGRVEEYLLKGPADYRVWEWIVEHTSWEADYDAYRAYDAEIGEDGLPMISVGDVPFHEFMQHLAGYEDGFLQLHDHRTEVEHLLATMQAVQAERLWPVVAASPARLLLHGVHLSSQFTPPTMFDRYVIPYYEGFMPLMHAHGKSVAMHADNDVSRIMEHIERAGWDMVECFVTAPMVPLTMVKARQTWGNRVSMWGGLPSLLLSPSVSESDFRDFMNALLDEIAPGDAFVLGVADNVMPDSLIERVAWVSDWVHEKGALPLR